MEAANKQLPSKAVAYTDYRELLRDKNVGAVVIITPGYLHRQMALDAIRAGKDVVLEKPMGLTYAEAKEIEREAARSGRIVAVCMQRRYSRADTETRKIVESGALGPLRLITCSEFRGDWHPETWQYTDPATGKKTSWRLLRKTAGSSELEFSIHAFAEVCELVKSPPARIAASGGVVHYRDRETRDVSNVLVDFANGVRFSYSFSCFVPRGSSQLTLVGDNGWLNRSRGVISVQTGGKAPQEIKLGGEGEGGSAEASFYEDFFESVRTRKQPALNPTAAMEPAKIAFGADWSITENRIVTARDFT